MKKLDIYHENKTHAQGGFPCNIYICHIPKNMYEVANHHHKQHEIIVVKSGEGVVSVNLEKIHVTQGDVIFVPKNTLHAIYQKDSIEMSYETIIFEESLIFCVGDLDAEGFPTLICKSSCIYAQIMNCIDKIDSFSDKKREGYQLMVQSALVEIFYYLNVDKVGKPLFISKTALSVIKRVVLYVDEHYAEDITVGKIASEMGYSKSRFMALFSNFMNTTFTKYLADIRLGYAKIAILQTGEKITTISQNCGFANISYFNRLFKEKYNQSPSELRKK